MNKSIPFLFNLSHLQCNRSIAHHEGGRSNGEAPRLLRSVRLGDPLSQRRRAGASAAREERDRSPGCHEGSTPDSTLLTHLQNQTRTCRGCAAIGWPAQPEARACRELVLPLGTSVQDLIDRAYLPYEVFDLALNRAGVATGVAILL